MKKNIIKSCLNETLSPNGALFLICLSYFYLLNELDFVSVKLKNDLFVLGLLTIAGYIFIAKHKIRTEVVDIVFINKILNAINIIYFIISLYLISVLPWSISALVDTRFSISGYGLLYPMYYIGALLGACSICILKIKNSKKEKIVFFFLFCYIGYIIGGKGFFFPFLFGVIFASKVGLLNIELKYYFLLILTAIVTVFFVLFSITDDLNLIRELLAVRIQLAADAVNWVSKMSNNEVIKFPITSVTFITDLFTRFWGIRVNKLAVGSEIANIVAGDDSGGGPNPNFPVLAILISQGDLLSSFLFIIFSLLILYFLLSILKKTIRMNSKYSIFYSLSIFLSPILYIDLLMYIQFLFCIMFLAVYIFIVSKFFS